MPGSEFRDLLCHTWMTRAGCGAALTAYRHCCSSPRSISVLSIQHIAVWDVLLCVHFYVVSDPNEREDMYVCSIALSMKAIFSFIYIFGYPSGSQLLPPCWCSLIFLNVGSMWIFFGSMFATFLTSLIAKNLESLVVGRGNYKENTTVLVNF